MRQRMGFIFLCAVFAIIGLAAWFQPLEATAERQVDAGLKRALVSFATARTLNAVISAAQGTELSIEPGGVGVKFAPGQILRPMNELVGQFAELMLAASVAFGIMKVLMIIGSNWVVSLLLSVAAVGWIWYRWRDRSPPVLLARVLFVLLLVRFAVPLVIVGSDALFENFMAQDYIASQGAIDGNSNQLNVLGAPMGEVSAKCGIFELRRCWEMLSQNVDISARLANLKTIAGQTVEHVVKLIVVFLLQTLVVPVFLFWALYRIGSALFEMPRRGSA